MFLKVSCGTFQIQRLNDQVLLQKVAKLSNNYEIYQSTEKLFFVFIICFDKRWLKSSVWENKKKW